MNNIDLYSFVNSFAVKPNKTMSFLLGAGSSIASGIPSGGQMVWEFKRNLYCAARNVRTSNFSDMSKQNAQVEIQKFFDGHAGNPKLWSSEEYSFYFEKCYPSRKDREFYIQNKVRDIKPSLGYLCMGELIVQEKINLVSTTNFDDLVLAGIHSIRPDLSVKTISSAKKDSMGFSVDDGFPNIIKLHGDYLYDKLKNTEEELQKLENEISNLFKEAIRSSGLIVIGYAGNDNSVMTVLEELISLDQVKRGIFWCQPKGVSLSNRAKEFMDKACSYNDESGVVEISSYDDLMYRLFLTLNMSNSIIDNMWAKSDLKQPILYDNIGRHKSVMITNGLYAIQYPRKCYVFETDVSSWKELREIIDDTFVAALYKGSVWALGSKTGIVNAFGGKIKGEVKVK